jgi:uncharacterized membrane protein
MEGMMRRALAVTMIGALALAGCGGGGESGGGGEGNRRQIKITGDIDYEARLRALSEMNRGLALRRAIQDSGQRCKKIEASGYQERYKNMSMWTARCSDTGEFALFIAPNGSIQARKCADAVQLKLPACRVEEAAASMKGSEGEKAAPAG